jgi:hypothetical protein
MPSNLSTSSSLTAVDLDQLLRDLHRWRDELPKAREEEAAAHAADDEYQRLVANIEIKAVTDVDPIYEARMRRAWKRAQSAKEVADKHDELTVSIQERARQVAVLADNAGIDASSLLLFANRFADRPDERHVEGAVLAVLKLANLPHTEHHLTTYTGSTICYHGGQSYSLGSENPIAVNSEEHNFLKAFLDRETARTTRELERCGCSNVSRVAEKLNRKFPGAIRKPEHKGDGYFACVRRPPQNAMPAR